MKCKYRIILTVLAILFGLLLIYRLTMLLLAGSAVAIGTPVDKNQPYNTIEECINAAARDIDDINPQEDYVIENLIYEYENDDYCYRFYLGNDDLTVSYFALQKIKENSSVKYFCDNYKVSVQYDSYEWYEIGDCHYRVMQSKNDIVRYNDVLPEVIDFTVDTVQGDETRYLLFSKT